MYTSAGQAVDLGRSTGKTTGTTYVYKVIPACSSDINDPGTICRGAYTSCPDEGDVRYYVFYKQTAPTEGGWERSTEYLCLGPQPELNKVAVSNEAKHYLDTMPVGPPGIHVAPPKGAIAHLPAIVWTNAAPAKHHTTSAFGTTISITATPRFSWSFGDGTTQATTWTGRGYDGTDPRTSPSHYVTHTYKRAKPAVTISVTAIWTGTYRIGSDPHEYPIDGDVRRTSSVVIPVKEYAGVLTGYS